MFRRVSSPTVVDIDHTRLVGEHLHQKIVLSGAGYPDEFVAPLPTNSVPATPSNPNPVVLSGYRGAAVDKGFFTVHLPPGDKGVFIPKLDVQIIGGSEFDPDTVDTSRYGADNNPVVVGHGFGEIP